MENNERELIVLKQNDLIQKTRYELSTEQQKILLYVISKIKPTDDTFTQYEIPVVDIIKLLNINGSGKNYQNIKKAIKDLADKSFWLETENTDYLVRWLEQVELDKNEAVIKAKLNPQLAPYLLHVKKHFTIFQIYNTLAMRSKYSIRLYEILKSYSYKQEIEFLINDFRKRIGIEKTYPQFRSIKKFVLDPAKNEINDFTDLHIEYKTIRKSNRVVAIHFDIKIINQEQLVLPLSEYVDFVLEDKRKWIKDT